LQPSVLLALLLVSGQQTFTANFAIPNERIEQIARRNDGASANPEQIRIDVDCRAARPRFDKGAWSPAKISDVTGGDLYLFVTPGDSRPGNGASKLWRMGYRFNSRQKTYSIGPYGNGKDGTSHSPMRGANTTRPKICSRQAKTRARRSNSTSTGRGALRPFEQWGRRVAREEEGESQTRQDRRGARP
jgi:hypothetical protein